MQSFQAPPPPSSSTKSLVTCQRQLLHLKPPPTLIIITLSPFFSLFFASMYPRTYQTLLPDVLPNRCSAILDGSSSASPSPSPLPTPSITAVPPVCTQKCSTPVLRLGTTTFGVLTFSWLLLPVNLLRIVFLRLRTTYRMISLTGRTFGAKTRRLSNSACAAKKPSPIPSPPRSITGGGRGKGGGGGMLDINLFRVEKGNNPEHIRESQRRRFANVEIVDEVIALDKAWRQCQFELDNLRKDFKKHRKEIAYLDNAKELMKERKNSMEEKEEEVKAAKAELYAKLMTIGNLVHDSVPVSDDEADNLVVRTSGECRTEGKLWNHVDLVEMLGIADLKRGADVAGGRCFYLKDDGVLLNIALYYYGLAFLKKRNYSLLHTPFFMRKEVMAKCAQLAQFDEELYKVVGDGDDKYLIATSEQPLCAYHLEERIYPADLPIRYAGYSTCFRKEAGSHGRDTLGIFRVHQFEKVEQFCITSPNNNESWEMHEEMLKNCEDFYQELKLPYQVVSIVSGALNDAAAKKYDLEAWFPASKTFRELVSCSNCTDYQARRLGIGFGQKKNDEQAKQFVHLLNSTLTATERTICCILENYQREDRVVIPKVLQPFMFGIDFLPFKYAPRKKK